MNNQPSAEDLLKRAMDLLNDKDVLFNDAGLLHDLSMLENDVIAFNLASREVSAAVTPLSWEEAKQKVADKYFESNFDDLLWSTAEHQDKFYTEAAQLFMSSNRDSKQG